MFAQGFDKVDDSSRLSVLAGAYAALGARTRGARVFFGVMAPFAERVYLTGSFNGWSESASLEKNEHGIWQTSISREEISDGDKYKFKAYVNGEVIYLSDPYASESDGEPYFNAIYREPDGELGDESSCRIPLNVYEIVPDKWLCYDGRGAVDYETLARELLPYLLQMGYTHVCVSGECREEQGGESAFKIFADMMHSAKIGVLVREDFKMKDRACIDGTVAVSEDAESFSGLVHKICFEGASSPVTVKDSVAYRRLLRETGCGKSLRENAVAQANLLFREGRMLTRMGCEAGIDTMGGVFNRRLFESDENARFQLFCSELAEIYLSNPEIWECSAISAADDGGVRVIRRYAPDIEMILVSDLLGNGGGARIPVDGGWRVKLDASDILGYKNALVSYAEDGYINILLPQYGAVIIERIK